MSWNSDGKLNMKPLSKTPLVSMVIICYNQSEYIRAAIEGALAQDYSPLEIIISDDCSPDDTYDVVKKVTESYAGPHRIILNRNEVNLRVVGNVNTAMSLASGEIIVMAGGDDISFSNRCSRSVELLSAPDVNAVGFDTHTFSGEHEPHLDQGGQNIQIFDKSAYSANPLFHINGASRAFKRDIIDIFGSISVECPAEDTVFLLRSCLLGNVIQSSEIMVNYRIHDNNVSSESGLSKFNFHAMLAQYKRDLSKAVDAGILNTTDYNLLTLALEKRNRIIYTRKEFNLAGAGLPAFFRYLAFSKDFSPLRKVKELGKIALKRKKVWS